MIKNQVDIIISCHNAEKYLMDSIKSILSQSYTNYTINIADDNSIDNTKNIVDYTIKNNPDKKITVTSLKRVGPTVARQKAIDNCNGEYFLILDSDDMIHQNFLEKTVSVLREHKDKSFCYTNTVLFGEQTGFWDQPEYDFGKLLLSNYICYCSLIRRKDFNECGGFDLDNFAYYEDYENWINMGKNGKYGIHLPEYLFLYRIRKDSSINSPRSKAFGNIYKMYIISKYPELYDSQTVSFATQTLKNYPSNFMQMSIEQQEELLKCLKI
jgi:glycosyltransferase involved in cell wall biosynthesis